MLGIFGPNWEGWYDSQLQYVYQIMSLIIQNMLTTAQCSIPGKTKPSPLNAVFEVTVWLPAWC